MNLWIRHGVVAVVAAGCRGQPDLPGDCDCGGRPVVRVREGDVARLYEVVGDPGNAGKCVRLEPGTYALDSALDPGGRGILVLQPGMALVGSNHYRDGEDLAGHTGSDGLWDPWDPEADPAQYPDPATETVLDASGAHSDAVDTVGCGDPPDHGGRDASAITLVHDAALRCVSVQNYFASGVGVVAFDTRDLGVEAPANGTLSAEVSDCVIRGGHVGVGINLEGCGVRGRTASATLERNIVTGSGYTGAFFMSTLTEDVAAEVSISHNRFEGNNRGLQAIAGVIADRCTLAVTSLSNSYSNNAEAGLSLMAQADTPNLPERNGGHDNTLTWTSIGDRIVGNGHTTGFSTGGAGVSGTILHYDRPLGASGNHTDARFQDTVFVAGEGDENLTSDGRMDVFARGYWGIYTTAVHPDNTVALTLNGCVSDGTPVYFDHSEPEDPEGTNRVTIVGGAESLAADNEGIPGAVER